MVKYLRKVGNSSAIILDKSLMELAGLEEGDPIQIRFDSGSILLTPVAPRQATPAEFKAALDSVVKDHGTVLRRLAK